MWDIEGVIDAFLDGLSSGTFPMPMLLKLRAIHPLENLMKTTRLTPQKRTCDKAWHAMGQTLHYSHRPALLQVPQPLLSHSAGCSVPYTLNWLWVEGDAQSWRKGDEIGRDEKLVVI